MVAAADCGGVVAALPVLAHAETVLLRIACQTADVPLFKKLQVLGVRLGHVPLIARQMPCIQAWQHLRITSDRLHQMR